MHRGHPSSTERPPRPLCSAAGRRRPRANFAGEEEATRLTDSADGPGGPEGLCVSARRQGRLTFPSAEPAAPVT